MSTRIDEVDLARLKGAEDHDILLAILEELIAIEERLLSIKDTAEKIHRNQ